MFRTPIYAIRHGETAWNAEGRFQGASDIPLSALGREQAARNGLHLAGHLAALPPEARPVRALSSPLSRAMETLAIVRRAIGLPDEACSTDARLAEAGFGRWEGLTTQEVKARFPEERRLRKRDRWNFAAEGGRSYADLANAVRGLLDEFRGGAPVLVVSHSGNLRVMFGMLQALPEDETMRLPIPHDRILVWTGHGVVVI